MNVINVQKMNNKFKNKFFKNKTILITGGTGSFGYAVTKTLLKNYGLKKIIIFLGMNLSSRR